MLHKKKVAIIWAEDYLFNHEYTLLQPHELICEMPWAKVIRFITSQGNIYCKQTAALFSIEPTLIQFLRKHIVKNVPQVIISNKKLCCFLMKDAGTPLRQQLKTNYQSDLFCDALKLYASLQKKTIPHVDELLNLGLPDWRLNQLPTLYLHLLQQKKILFSDGVTSSEIETLQVLSPKFTELCNCLSQYKIPETIEHGDFHDNNILINNHHFTINDWGEATISHPFFSLASCLNSAIRKYGFKKTDQQYLDLQNIYLTQWLKYGTKEQLLEAFQLAEQIRYVQFALSFSYVVLCSGTEKLKQYRGYIAEPLRDFIKKTIDYDAKTVKRIKHRKALEK
jgi:hypothetical protein